jgi:acetyl-CoA carboxylase alpha subunit
MTTACASVGPRLVAGPAAGELDLVAEWDSELGSTDPLRFPGYHPPAPQADSVRTGLGRLGDRHIAVVDCSFEQAGGTMGAVAGERIVRAFRRATEDGLPVVALVSSGGVRLQEGMVALVQMARTATAVQAHRAAGLLSAAVLRSPTTGGVYASWAGLADLRAAEPGATIGFGGPRVVAQVTGEWPPSTSHTAESAFRAGLVDALVPRPSQWAWVEEVLGLRRVPLRLPDGRPQTPDPSVVPSDPWYVVTRARSPQRPSGLEWAAWLTDSWVELNGSDAAIRAGIATIEGSRVVVVAMDRHARGDAAARPTPAGYRLARRAVTLADRLGLPVVTLVDTPGAEPGPAAEAAGIAGEIAELLLVMAGCRTPTVALTVGEGGSGGAMAFAHADRLLSLSGAVFSVIGPEAGAAILYRDVTRAPELASQFRVTARDLWSLGVLDDVVDECTASVVDGVRRRIVRALANCRPGDRNRRIDAVTERALNTLST